MSHTEELERDRERRDERTGRLDTWEKELRVLAEMLADADQEHAWRVRYGYVDKTYPYRPITALVTTIGDDVELLRFVRDEHGIIGLFAGSSVPVRFTDRHAAFAAAVKGRLNFRR